MLLTYAVVDYSYFALAMTFTIEREAQSRAHARRLQQALRDGRIATPPGMSAGTGSGAGGHGASLTFDADLDRLFPERKKILDAPTNAGGAAAAGAVGAETGKQYGSVSRSESNVSEIIGGYEGNRLLSTGNCLLFLAGAGVFLKLRFVMSFHLQSMKYWLNRTNGSSQSAATAGSR